MKNAFNLVKDGLRSIAYRCGFLGLFHRLRNRRTLTILMFHRVLPAPSTEYECAEREFTMSERGFSRCLEFLKKHYNAVSLDEVKDAVDKKQTLPDRALLISFDDGWRDTRQYAMPALRRLNLPAVVFIVTEAVELAPMRWWQDMLVEIAASPDRLSALVEQLDMDHGLVSEKSFFWRLTAKLSELSDGCRHALLDPLAAWEADSRQMLTADELPLLKPVFSIGGHGHSHAPLSECRSVSNELEYGRAYLNRHGGDDQAMSFPHGAYSDDVVRLAWEAGYRYLFSSDPHLVDSGSLAADKRPFGRIHMPENQWTCDGQGISFPKLASFLFFRPIV
jgi:peptidoglycan/xylan/chitin deacetylase (PgdA/CDA1 family)